MSNERIPLKDKIFDHYECIPLKDNSFELWWVHYIKGQQFRTLMSAYH